MPNSFDADGRGLSDRQLAVCGLVLTLLSAVVAGTLVVKSTGRLNNYIRVVAELANVGDGLPEKSDVKFQEVLVGWVADVDPAQHGQKNVVSVNLQPGMARVIPESVTARVIPSNAFGVSAIELVDHGPGPAIVDGVRIEEDAELPTLLFQTTVDRLRDILAATGRGREDHTVGLLAAISAATNNRRPALLTAGAHLTRLLDDLNDIVATDTGPSTLAALIDATNGLKGTAPELVDALHEAVKPMQTIAEKRLQLQNLLSAGGNTVGTLRQGLDNHIDQLLDVTGNLSPSLAVLAKNSNQFLPMMVRLKGLSERFFEVWDPASDTFTLRANLSLTPATTYTRADCPQYGELKAPSCFTAPEIPVRADLPGVLLPQNFQPPKDLAPPPGTALGPDGNLLAVGPPLVNRESAPAESNSPFHRETERTPRPPNSDDLPPVGATPSSNIGKAG